MAAISLLDRARLKMSTSSMEPLKNRLEAQEPQLDRPLSEPMARKLLPSIGEIGPLVCKLGTPQGCPSMYSCSLVPSYVAAIWCHSSEEIGAPPLLASLVRA